jgi:ribonuclease E
VVEAVVAPEPAVVAEPVAVAAAEPVADLGGLVLVTTRPAAELPVVEVAPVEVKGKRRREVVREVADVAPLALVQVQTARDDS